jgi:hypothetical protein
MGDELDAVFAALQAVVGEVTFIAFVHTLAMDRAAATADDADALPSPWGPSSRGWENTTIETFLESASAWASDSRHGLAAYAVPDNPWRRCADILFAGKHYE